VSPTTVAFAAVILTGGGGARLGGVDKASLQVGGVGLLEHALTATAAAGRTVVVGDPVPTARPVVWARESPPGGGPAAGLLAGVDALEESPAGPPDLLCALAVDMPRVTAGTVRRLLAALDDDPRAEAACLHDRTGREQWLAAVYRAEALRRVRPPDPAALPGLAMRHLVGPLRRVPVAAVADEAADVDTWADLRRLEG
jgi:molybdopterin-guanine dinucleotide biosynthesis protein A